LPTVEEGRKPLESERSWIPESINGIGASSVLARPWETLATVPTPEGPLALRRRGEKDFLITINGRVLMSSAAHRSEDALAKLACAGLRDRRRARVLVSGLGMGFTLRAAVDELAEDAEVTVAELNRIVVEWCKGPLGPLVDNVVHDPRVTVEIVDVSAHIADVARRGDVRRFDAIVLDMYEGPHHDVHPNDPLYGPSAVRRVKKALTPDGVFAVWCEGPSAGFEGSLRAAGFKYRLQRAGRGARIHYVYLAHAGATRASRVNRRG
jgi:spermidine synthase